MKKGAWIDFSLWFNDSDSDCKVCEIYGAAVCVIMTYEQKCKKIMNPLDKSERSDYNKSILKFLEQRQVTC